MPFFRALAVALSLATLVAACSSDDTGDGSSGSSGSKGGSCADDTRKDVYAAGISKPADAMTVSIVDATPAPPAKGMNALTVRVVAGGGAPVEGATVTLEPFMPDHGHGSAAVPKVTAQGDGKYAIENVYLAMAGLWVLTVKVSSGGAVHEAKFSFCLDG